MWSGMKKMILFWSHIALSKYSWQDHDSEYNLKISCLFSEAVWMQHFQTR